MRLIDADTLYFYMTDSIEQQKAEEARDEAPTIDAVEVVRCKDCKYFNKLLPTIRSNAKCDLLYGMTDLLGYCSLGERRDKDEADRC